MSDLDDPGDLDQRLLDGIRLTNDAHVAGQLAALEELRGWLEGFLVRRTSSFESVAEPVERAKARGARETLEHILRDVEWRIERVTLNRNR